jgi:hypothetical protein
MLEELTTYLMSHTSHFTDGQVTRWLFLSFETKKEAFRNRAWCNMYVCMYVCAYMHACALAAQEVCHVAPH